MPILQFKSRPNNILLSFAQQRLWFIDQLVPGRGIYNIPIVLKLKGKLNITALQQSFVALMSRHEILRTQFVYNDKASVVEQIALSEGQCHL